MRPGARHMLFRPEGPQACVESFGPASGKCGETLVAKWVSWVNAQALWATQRSDVGALRKTKLGEVLRAPCS